MFCHNCGQALPVEANFCSRCGVAVSARAGAPYAPSPFNTMYRPRTPRMIAGVCAALHIRYRWDLTAMRILAVVLAIFLFPLAEIAYLVAWLLIPEEGTQAPQPDSTVSSPEDTPR